MRRFALALLVAGVAAGGSPALAQDQPPAAQPTPPVQIPQVQNPQDTPVPPLPIPPPAPPAAAIPAPTPPLAMPAPAPAPEEGRYSIHPVGDKFVRLDIRTGQVSVCGHGPTGWACQAVADDRVALDAEFNRLQAENAALKKTLLARGVELPGSITAPPPVARAPDKPAPPEVQLPSDAELNRVFAFTEKVWRRMIEMMASIQRDIQRKN